MRRYTFPAVIIAAATHCAHAEIIHVNITAAPNGDGTSWTTAYNRLQDALANTSPGDQIWIAKGIYRPTEVNGPRDATFMLPNDIALHGGFAGNETHLEQADPIANRTTLSGDINPSRTPGADDAVGNSFHVVTAINVTATLTGLHITAGHAHQARDEYGGGISAIGSILDLNACVIHDNRAVRGAGMNAVGSVIHLVQCRFIANTVGHEVDHKGRGGGIRAFESSLMIESCEFRENTAIRSGGAIDIEQGTLTIRDSLFKRNHVGPDEGGGGIITKHTDVVIRNTEFVRNTSASGGAAVIRSWGTLLMEDSLFQENQAVYSGGAMVFANGTDGAVRNTSFIANIAGGSGGAIQNFKGETRIENCAFHGNIGQRGGGIHSFASPVISGCVFTGNQASYRGGAIFVRNGAPRILNCTIVGNTAADSGGGIKARNAGYPIVRNTILWNNLPEQIEVDQPGSVAACFSIVEHGWTEYGSANVLDIDPMFIDPDGPDDILGTPDDDVRLQPGSPAIDAGANPHLATDTYDLDRDGVTLEPIPLDADTNPRASDDPATPDTGIGAEAIVDLGAFEFEGIPDEPLFGDLDGDDVVGITDLLILIGDWGLECDCCLSDLTDDQLVGINDLQVLLGVWQGATP